jgi:hypothetical protein
VDGCVAGGRFEDITPPLLSGYRWTADLLLPPPW